MRSWTWSTSFGVDGIIGFMGREQLILAVAVGCSMGIMGWIIWSERPVPVDVPETVTTTPPTETAPVPVVDEVRMAELRTAAEADPDDVDSRLALAGAYFEAHSFEQAVPWYEQALALRPDDVESTTNLGVCYFYMGLSEQAVEQFDKSLELAPDHAQTLLSLGIVRAFGLEDRAGAVEAWERVLEVAPDGPEARAARDALSRVQ